MHLADHTPLSKAASPRKPRSSQQYSLAEKLSIVRESQQAGVSQAHVSRKYGLGKNVLWSWRKALARSDACTITFAIIGS